MDGQNGIQHVAAVVAVQVEVGVVGQVEHRILVACRLVGQAQGIVGGDGQGDGNGQAAGIPFLPVLRHGGQAQAGLVSLVEDGRFPDFFVKAMDTPVQVAAARLVAAHVVGAAVQREGAAGDAVGVPADGGTLVGAFGVYVILQPVVAQNDVFAGELHRLQGGAVGENGHFEAAGRRQAVLLHRRSVRQDAERSFFYGQHDFPLSPAQAGISLSLYHNFTARSAGAAQPRGRQPQIVGTMFSQASKALHCKALENAVRLLLHNFPPNSI